MTAQPSAAPALEARPELPGEAVSRVAMTTAALELIRRLLPIHGPLMFHQSGGCCDGSSPMCYPDGDFRTGDADVLLGTFALPAEIPAEGERAAVEIPFWMSAAQFEHWKHTHLTLDVVDGRGSGFSVEAPEGKRFLIRSRLMDTTDAGGPAVAIAPAVAPDDDAPPAPRHTSDTNPDPKETP